MDRVTVIMVKGIGGFRRLLLFINVFLYFVDVSTAVYEGLISSCKRCVTKMYNGMYNCPTLGPNQVFGSC